MTAGATAVSQELQAQVERSDVDHGTKPARQFTGIVVFDGTQWSSLSPELDVASSGEDAREAIVNLKHAVREALSVAAEKGIAAGRPTDKADLFEFISGHKGPRPAFTESFLVFPD